MISRIIERSREEKMEERKFTAGIDNFDSDLEACRLVKVKWHSSRDFFSSLTRCDTWCITRFKYRAFILDVYDTYFDIIIGGKIFME